MLKSLLRLAPTRSVLCPNLQVLRSGNQSLLTVSASLLSKTSRNCAKVATEENAENETQPPKTHYNPFAQDNLASNMDKNTNSAPTASEEERSKLLKVLQLEVDIAHQEGRRVPALESVTDENWAFILTLPSKSARYKYYTYLWQIEAKKQAKERKKEERALQVLERKEEMRKEREANPHIIYGLGHTSIFLRIYDSAINDFMNNRLSRAMQFSPKIVLDCSYDRHMTRRESLNAAKQLMLCFAENRAHDDPFDLHYCNVNLDSVSIKALKRYIPTMLNPEFPMNVHEKCFTELFPKENLVYLTPHCRTDLEVYNPDDVYIVGAMVDTVNNEPLSLGKAKRLGIRMARLPLDRYLQWGAGSGKSLTLNHMVNILLDLKSTKDWAQALKHVPRRKVVDMAADAQRQRRTLENRANKLNFRLDDILDENHRNECNVRKSNVRTPKKKTEFNLETWGSKK
ncbi:PREDICTED: mitochondrial ribonuclease P protein 1 homolog [Rhagoletis zephyria]|uniref:mitochondrial ribonuclease P protein 1 homolog n=1 Tax=Rhagoletis zephyria TaxID=28612 RepID=UPI0008115500|nr:PREDICTED: mitochondrial ribonuclease P protein 1 homolog [Rhagoletis zephyria]